MNTTSRSRVLYQGYLAYARASSLRLMPNGELTSLHRDVTQLPSRSYFLDLVWIDGIPRVCDANRNLRASKCSTIRSMSVTAS
jgi:hypothetical protein